MNTKLSELVLTLEDRLQFFWNFYFGTCLAVLAFVAGVTNKIPQVGSNYWLKAAVSSLFLMFVIGNLDGLLKFALRAKEAIGKLRAGVAPGEPESAPVIVSHLSFRFAVPAAIIGHIVGDLIVLASIWVYLNPK